MASISPKMSSAERRSIAFTSWVHSISRGPRIGVSQVSCGFLHRTNSVKFRIRAVAETFELGKDKPNPVAVFAAVFQFCHHARDNGLLRVDESLQVVIVIHKHGLSQLPFSSRLWLTRNTCPSGWRKCISRTCQGMLLGGNVTSSPAATHCLCIESTSSTHTDIHTPLSLTSSPSF